MKPLTGFFARLSAEERTVFKRQLAAIFVIITLLNLGFYWQRALREASLRHNLHSVMIGWDGLAWYVWMPAAPATLLLIRRFPVSRKNSGSSIAGLTLGSVAIYAVITNSRYLLRMTPNLWLPDTFDLPMDWETYLNTQIQRIPLDFLTYSGLFAASFAVDYYSKYRQRAEEVLSLQLQAVELQSEVAKLQLAALRGQLHPHFLFNSFNAIATLVRQHKNDLAVETIVQLGALLRFAMEKIEQQELPFEQELEFIRSYLNIERIRFGEKLRVVLEIAPDTLDGLVPNLLLQPLVENAIKHGISKRLAPGEVRIAARRRAGRLLVDVVDDGPGSGVEPDIEAGPGIGLRNTRGRLKRIYGADFRLEIQPTVGGGTAVHLDLPWRDAPVAIRRPEAVAT